MEGEPLTHDDKHEQEAVVGPTISVEALVDPVVEAFGHEPLSLYVETCWLPVLGPTATWLYRRLGSWAAAEPDGCEVDLRQVSQDLGLGNGLGRNSLLVKALGRLERFGVAQVHGDYMRVRRALGSVPEAQAQRFSPLIYDFHLRHRDPVRVVNSTVA